MADVEGGGNVSRRYERAPEAKAPMPYGTALAFAAVGVVLGIAFLGLGVAVALNSITAATPSARSGLIALLLLGGLFTIAVSAWVPPKYRRDTARRAAAGRE